MRWLRQYDRDLRRVIILAHLLTAANILSALYFALVRQWTLALSNGLWACNLMFQARTTTQEQRLRDEVRLLKSMEER